MTAPRIRAATVGDATAVRDIYAPIVRETSISFEMDVPAVDEIERRIREVGARVPWLVAERNGAVAGYAYATVFRRRAAYRWSMETSVYVHANHRRSGVGRALMLALIDVCRALHYRVLVAGATLPNDASERFHRLLGFTPVGVFPRVGRKREAWHGVGFWTLDLGGDDPPEEPLPPDAIEDLDALLARHAAVIAL
ncbi:MAG: N-acetyltransferase family protein [Planctomycetota bacterium]